VRADEVEAAVAQLLELVPEGHEVRSFDGGVEFAVYVPRSDLDRILATFPATQATDVEPGWQDAWRRFHVPVTVGPLWVGPPWESPVAGLLPVVIDPGQAFGTGSHPTTRLCLELLSELEPGSLLDLGCGSGVLAIAAARLGFEPVIAGDTDELAVAATVENALRNGVTVDARVLDALGGDLPKVDVAVANIVLEVVDALAPHVRCERLLLSGYLEHEAPTVVGLAHIARRTSAGWAADLYARE
jgi:ribosomal protein L11 methyltransferase